MWVTKGEISFTSDSSYPMLHSAVIESTDTTATIALLWASVISDDQGGNRWDYGLFLRRVKVGVVTPHHGTFQVLNDGDGDKPVMIARYPGGFRIDGVETAIDGQLLVRLIPLGSA